MTTIPVLPLPETVKTQLHSRFLDAITKRTMLKLSIVSSKIKQYADLFTVCSQKIYGIFILHDSTDAAIIIIVE